jgi:hypothetical protein
MVKNKNHLTIEGTIQIIELAYFMNRNTSLRSELTKQILLTKLEVASHNKLAILPVIKLPVAPTIKPLTLEFVRGLVDGDGSFNVAFRTNRKRISVNFTIVDELSAIPVLNELVEFFKCGTVYKLPTKAARYQIQTVDEILDKIVPRAALKNIRFNTEKQINYEIFIKVCLLIKNNGYKNDKDLKSIVELA